MAANEIRHFLVVYDVGARQAKVREFDDYETAVAAYDRVEQEHLGREDLGIVLFGADSLEQLADADVVVQAIQKADSKCFDATADSFERFFRDRLAA